MKILQVNASWQLGGAETVARQLLHGCGAQGHESAMMVAVGKYFPRGVGVIPMYPRLLSRLQMSRFHPVVEKMFPRFKWTDRTLRNLQDSKWDVIHVHNFHGDYASIESLGNLARQKSVVWTFHGCWGFTGGCDHTAGCPRYQESCGSCPQIGRWPFLAHDNTAAQLQEKLRHFRGKNLHVISPSRWLGEKIQTSQVGAQWNVRVIPNGVDTTKFDPRRKAEARQRLGIAADRTVIVVVNRNFQDGNKGFAMALEALLMNRFAPMDVHLLGMNSDWAVAQLEGIPAVGHGYVSSSTRLLELYEAADILLFASPEENFPCTVVEAMAAECCVVATPTGGVCEQIEHRISGFLAEAIDGRALGAALHDVLENPELRNQCAAKAALRARNEFDEVQMVQRHLELYRELGDTCPCD